MDEPVSYTVVAELPDEKTLASYISWLVDRHIAMVVAGGAARAEVIGPDPAGSHPLRVESRFTFATLAAFRAYEAGPAQALRAEGLEKFGPQHGVRMSRILGKVLSVREGGKTVSEA